MVAGLWQGCVGLDLGGSDLTPRVDCVPAVPVCLLMPHLLAPPPRTGCSFSWQRDCFLTGLVQS